MYREELEYILRQLEGEPLSNWDADFIDDLRKWVYEKGRPLKDLSVVCLKLDAGSQFMLSAPQEEQLLRIQEKHMKPKTTVADRRKAKEIEDPADPAPIGHNKPPKVKFGGISGDQLRQYIDRIERVDQEKGELADHLRDIFAEAKGNGFDTKAMRRLIKLRKLGADERMEQEAIDDMYKHALGMIGIED